ncbi:MAG TPA: MarR family winged helix-turn-helix transcriptional regulator [Gemmatimonadaceae bacterium]
MPRRPSGTSRAPRAGGTRPAPVVPSRPSAPPRARGATPQVVDAFRRIVRALRLAEQEGVAKAGMSAAQLFVLHQLEGDNASSLSELAARTMTDRTSVAAVVERLEAARLVVTARDAADRRRVTVRLTPAGARLLRRAPAPPTQLLVRGTERLPAAARTALAKGLRALLEEMELAEGPVPMLFEGEPTAGRASRRGSRSSTSR